MTAICTSISPENENFAQHMIENVMDISALFIRAYGHSQEGNVSISIGDATDDNGRTRHFFHKDKRVMSMYMGKQGIILFKTKW